MAMCLISSKEEWWMNYLNNDGSSCSTIIVLRFQKSIIILLAQAQGSINVDADSIIFWCAS